MLRGLLNEHPNAMLTFLTVDADKFSHFTRVIERISVETYFRYLVAELLPHVARVLYLDADTVVVGDLGELWQLNMEGALMAGVHDNFMHGMGPRPALGLTQDEPYVNAGVLLFDTEGMRREGITAKLFETTQLFGENLTFQDQDALNIVMKGRIKTVDKRYNLMSIDAIADPKLGLREAKIIHYTGSHKPWEAAYSTPNFTDVFYYEYLRKTPYASRFAPLLRDVARKERFSRRKCMNWRRVMLLGLSFFYCRGQRGSAFLRRVKR